MLSGFDSKTPWSKIKFAYLLLILASEAEVGADPSILCLILGESALDDPDDMEAMGLLYSIECISELNTVSLRTLQPVCCWYELVTTSSWPRGCGGCCWGCCEEHRCVVSCSAHLKKYINSPNRKFPSKIRDNFRFWEWTITYWAKKFEVHKYVVFLKCFQPIKNLQINCINQKIPFGGNIYMGYRIYLDCWPNQ